MRGGRSSASFARATGHTHDKCAILDWRDYFISYTNRDAATTNQEFRQLIRESGFRPRASEDQNYVARVINKHLRKYQGLVGFFDESNLQVGDDIQDAVTDYCQKSFAFVQLVERVTCTSVPSGQNWCFHEYTTFTETPVIQRLFGDKDRHFFIATHDEVDQTLPLRSPRSHAAWCDRIRQVLRLSLEGERHRTLSPKMRDIAVRIAALRQEIIEAWLAE